MDPNANLKEQREIATRMLGHNQYRAASGPSYSVDATRLAELVQALDGWITNGGFLPEAWTKP